MSAPAQVTEAHLELAKTVIFSRDSAGRLLTAPMGARLIADSEAKATVELKKKADHWCDMHTVCAKERDQLRAEVQRLKSEGAASAFITMSCRASRAETERNNLRADLDAIKAILIEEKARAERAEASLHALRLVCGTTDANKFSTWVDRANARAERAESELAGIRALADRRNKRYHVEDTTHQLVAALDQALDIAQAELATERGRLNWILRLCATGVFYRAESRAAIDAAMKRGTK